MTTIAAVTTNASVVPIVCPVSVISHVILLSHKPGEAGNDYYIHCVYKETQRGEITHPGSHSYEVADRGFKPGSSGSRAALLGRVKLLGELN